MSGGRSIMSGASTLGGIVMTAMGMPEVGIPLALGGAGSLIGGLAGGNTGAALGGGLGGLAGVGADAAGGMSGVLSKLGLSTPPGPSANATPSLPATLPETTLVPATPAPASPGTANVIPSANPQGAIAAATGQPGSQNAQADNPSAGGNLGITDSLGSAANSGPGGPTAKQIQTASAMAALSNPATALLEHMMGPMPQYGPRAPAATLSGGGNITPSFAAGLPGQGSLPSELMYLQLLKM